MRRGAPSICAGPARPIAMLSGAALVALLLVSCASRLPAQRSLTIAPEPVPCADGTPGACLRVTEPKGVIWIMGPDEITGFTYEPGFTYELLVEEPSVVSEEEAPAPTRLTLIRVLSKQAAAPSEQAPAARLGQGRWVLASVQPSGHSAEAWAASGITAAFDVAAGRLSGSAGCNDYTATLTITGDRLAVSAPAATRKMCPSETMMALEQEYLARLPGASSFALSGDRLDLSLADGSGVEFRAGPQ
jgi:heat shock protein HslJ